jgi:uncharacterized protein YneF (UPF0154 family)
MMDAQYRPARPDVTLAILRLVVMVTIGALCLAAFLLIVGAPLVLVFSEQVSAWISGGADSPSLTALVLLMIGVAGLCGFAIGFFYLLMKITDTVRDGDPFVPENATRLALMAWTALAGHAWAFILTIPGVWFASSVGAGARDAEIDASFGTGSAILILVLFVLARVFRHGSGLREDLAGTI